MKKKTLILIFCCIICFVPNMVFADQFSDKEIKKVQMWADYVSEMRSEKDLKERAEYIVKATILPQSENIYLGKIDGCTKTKIQINEVYKGDIKLNEVITLMEPYFSYYDEEDDVIYEFHSELYNKSEVVNEYYGRYPVPAKERTVASVEDMKPEDFNLYDGYIGDYKKIYDEIVNIYQ